MGPMCIETPYMTMYIETPYMDSIVFSAMDWGAQILFFYKKGFGIE